VPKGKYFAEQTPKQKNVVKVQGEKKGTYLGNEARQLVGSSGGESVVEGRGVCGAKGARGANVLGRCTASSAAKLGAEEIVDGEWKTRVSAAKAKRSRIVGSAKKGGGERTKDGSNVRCFSKGGSIF